MKNPNGNSISRTVDGRSSPIHEITVHKIKKSNPKEPDSVTFSVFKLGRKGYTVKFSAPIMGLTEWLRPFGSKVEAIDFAENMAEAT